MISDYAIFCHNVEGALRYRYGVGVDLIPEWRLLAAFKTNVTEDEFVEQLAQDFNLTPVSNPQPVRRTEEPFGGF